MTLYIESECASLVTGGARYRHEEITCLGISERPKKKGIRRWYGAAKIIETAENSPFVPTVISPQIISDSGAEDEGRSSRQSVRFISTVRELGHAIARRGFRRRVVVSGEQCQLIANMMIDTQAGRVQRRGIGIRSTELS